MGREGRGGEGGSIDTQLGSCHFLGGEGGEGRGGEGRGGEGRGGEGGSIDTQLGKDPQRLWKACLNLERICKDLGRIASTWKGSAMTLEGSPQLGKDLQ